MADTILLADESDTMRRVAQMTLAEQGFRVVSVADGQQALHALDAERPSVALLSVTLQKMDGFALARAIRDRPDAAHTPVLLLAGAFEPIDDGRVRESGAAGVLVKPYEPGLVIKRVKELLGMSQGPPHGTRDLAASSRGGRLVTNLEPPLREPRGFVEPPGAMSGADASSTADIPQSASAGTSPAETAGAGDAAVDSLEAVFGSERHPAAAPTPPMARPAAPSETPPIGIEHDGRGPRDAPLDPASTDIGGHDLQEWTNLTGSVLPPPVTQASFLPSPLPQGAFGGPIPAADAFAALLAAEQGEAPPPPPAVGMAPFEWSDDTVLELSRLIAEQLSERTDLADRLGASLGGRVAGEVAARVADTVSRRVPDVLPERLAEALPLRLVDALAERLAPELAERLADGLADRVAELVADRVLRSALGDALRRTVHDVSERLVREEIDRIRQRAASR